MTKKKENTAPMLSMDQIAKNYKKQQDNKNKTTTTPATAAKPKINGVESGIMLSYDKILDNWMNQQGDNAVSKITALYNKTKERNNLQTRGLPLYDKKGNMVAVPIADHTEYGRKKEREIQRLWEELIAQENRKNGNVELGSWLGTGASNNKAKEALDTRNARQHMDWFTGAIASGNYNNTDDVTQMNQEGLNSYLAQLQQSQKDLENGLSENRKSIEAQGTVDRTLPMLSLVDNDRTRNEWAIINGEGYTEQEKAKARETLEQLWNVGSAANPSAKTMADTYLKYIDNMDGAGSTPERMRQMAYDAMNGNGAYEKVTRTMQAADKKTLDDKIDNALAYIRDPNGQLGIDRRTMESELRTVMDDIKETQRQQQIWNDYNALMNLVPQGQNAEYVQENDVMKNYDYWTPSRQTGDLDAWAYSPNADMIYSFINGGYAWEQYTAGGYREVSGIMKYAELMNSAEVDQFNKFYNAGQKNEAMAFLDGLQSALSQRYVTQYETLSTRMRAREFPVISSIMTFGDTMLQPAEFVYNLVSSIFNNDSKNAYGGNYAITRHKAVTREQVGEDLGPVGKFFYDAAMSGGDSALNLAIGKCMGLTGKPLEAATLTLFSTQAFQTNMQRNLEESNGDFVYSFLEATVDSLIETATEIASLEALMGDPTNLIQYVLKTAAAEGSEEFVGAAFGPYVKEMLGRKNEWKTRADQILKAGGYDDGYGNIVKVNSYDEAARQAMREWNHDIVISTLSGAVSTGGGVFYGTARNIYNRAQTGRQIISPDNIKNGVSGADQILKIAGGMKEGSQSRAYADAIAKKTEKGKTPSNYEIGRLAETVWQETGEAQREVVGDITQRAVREQLVKEGVPTAEAEQYAALISGSLTGSRKLSRGDIKTLAKSESAMKVWLSYNTATEENKALNREIREATAGQRSIENTLMDLTGATAKQQSVIAGEVEQSIKETNSQEEAIDNLAQRRSELMSEDYAKLAKDLYKTEQKSKASSRYLDDIMKIRMAAMSMNQLPRTGLSQENAQKLYEAAQKEFEEKDKARIKHNVILEPGKGTATFDDVEFGTDEWKEKLRSLNSNQRAQVNVLAEVARRMGMRMEFVNDPTQSGNWGWQTKETGVVTVNVAGKYSKTGLSHNMLVTMSHELTHWLEHNSVEGYNQLRQYAVDSLRRKGVNVEALMISSIDNQNLARNTAKENNVKGWERIEVLDLNGAMAEVVARSCENLLGSKAFAKEVEETNPTLFKHIQNYIKNFMVRLREAVKGMRTSLSYEATALLNETEKIAEIWLGARAEAMGRKITAEPTLTLDEAMASPVVVFSLDSPIQMREDGMIAVHNLDERGLESDLRMGGFPMPSIAVLAKNKTWTAYGRISIFFGKDSVAPESGSILFNGDAYTPTLGDADVNTAEEALAYLMNQPQRKLHMSYSVTNMFRDFKRIRNLDEARRKAYRYQKLGPEEITKTYRMANKMEDDLFDKTDELMAAHGRKSVKNRGTGRSTIDHWIGRGMLYAAEEMEGQTGLEKEQKYEILQRNIDKAFDENEIQHFDFGSEGNDIYDMMLDYIDIASQMESGGGMMEAKPESVIPFSAVQAVVVPDTIDQALIRELIDAGMDRESIIEYDPSDLKDRAKKLKEVPELKPGVSFSMEQKTFDYDQSFRDQLVSYQKLPAKEKKLKNKFVLVGTTPKVLTDIGLVKLPMTLNYQHVGYMLEGSHPKDQYKEDHIFDIEALSHLPELIADPVAVIKDSDPGSVRVLVNMKARSGKDVIVPISINSRKTVNGQWMDVNALSTGYGSGGIINELIAYLQKDSDSDPRIYYINQKKTQQVIGDKRSKLTDDFMIPDGYIRRISEKDLTVNDAKYNRKKPLKTQTDTTQFNKWFGRSKVKNADGTPKIMYHGTPSQFTKFDKSKASYAGTYGKGFYFTDSVSHAAHYGNQMAVYLRAENPLKTTGHKIKREQMLRFLQAVAENDEYDFANYGYGETPESMIDKIYTGKGDLLLIQDVSSTAIGDTGEAMRLFNEVNGTHFDSIITDKETVVFQPNQIKSATDNIGTFDINSDDIRYSMEQLDTEYQEAVESGNLDRATEMLMDRLAETEGIIPFNAPHGYSGQHRDIAKLIKEGTPEAVARAAADMAQFVPENGVLIPMPPHEGTVETDTDTMILANAISKLTGRPVVVALESDPRESRYQAKSEGRKGVTAAEMGFRQVKDIPEGTMPIFVDNVVGSGVTADAARTAMGGGITLAYAKGTQSKGIEGLKRATVTYDKNGKLIPLSQRFDRSIRNVNYSMEQLDEEYENARKAGDEDTMRRLIDEVAERAFANSKVRDKNGKLLKVFHGTKAEFNKFMREYIGSTGRFEGSGFNFTPAEERASSYGGNVLAGYLNIQKPLSAEKKTISVAKLAQIIRSADPTGDNIISDYARETRDYGNESFVRREAMTAARNIWESSDNDVDIYSFISAADSDAEGLIEEFEKLGYDGLIHYNDDGTIKTAVAFSSNQFKRADPVNYDDNGNVIPLSQRFNREEKDIRYSMEQAPDMDVQAWMAGLTPGSLQTEDERALLQAWKDKRMSISLSIKRQLDYRAKIKRLENSADSLTPQEREDLVALRNKLQVQEEKQARLEKEMYQITSQEGFAGMMYQQNMVMKDFITGRTQDEINDTVDDMVHEVQRMAREIAATRKELEKLAEAEDLRNAQKALDGTDLNRNARRLKKDYRSKMTENEIQARLAEMALKLAAGGSMEDVAESARELAYDLGRLQNGYLGGAYGDLADRLKQVTIVIGPTQREQLAAQHSSIPNLRRQLAGSGVKIVFDPNLRGAGTLEDIGPGSEIHDLIPELGEDTGNMMNNLDVFVGLVQSTLKNLESEMLHDFDLDDAEMMIQGYALLASTELKGDPAMTTQVKRLLGLAKGEGGKAGELAERLKNAQDYLKGAIDKGEQAKGLTKMLRKDVDSAISYYNKTAAVAAKVEKQKVKEGLIAQLKSQHAQDLMKEQQKWRDLIEKDKTVRAMMQQNQELRRGITSDYTRIRKLLVNETDQKNIPEHMKSLARHMIRLLTENDLIGRKITNVQRQDLMETLRILDAMRQTDDDFTLDDLKMISDEEAQAAVAEALADLEDGIKFYNASPGSDRISNLQAFHNALDRVSEAVMTITGVIGAEQSVSFMGRRQLVADAAGAVRADLGRSRFKGELAGRGAKALRTGKRAVVYGNTTPVYFFKNLLNRGMDMIWKDMEWSENRNGLEMQRAKDFVGVLAARTGYGSWSGQKMKVTLGGMAREISIENVMELCAIWKRENTTNPEMSQHLAKGGVYIAEDEEESGKPRHERKQQRAWRVTDEEVAAMMEMLTPEQKEYMEGMVGYLSNEMSELGNEASMRMYGIKKYKEKYYFPMKVWDGVKSARSDKGITGTDENRAAHRSWSKRRINRARNALVIGNFTTDAVNHIVEMITYNTMAPAIENINKVLNYQFEEGANQDESTKRNLRIMFQEAYGKDALEYLETFMKDLNGGTVQDQRKTLRDRMLSIFKKNAVAGSLSVALQQPLSYIRAAMMINPKYLAQALNPTYWKGSHAEMVKYSGVAVIKDMGRFDMNFGQSAKDYVTPEGAMSKGRAVYEWISDKTTILPTMMDRMTWTRMWSAVKAEQKAQNPETDPKSDEFLQKVAERFNEVMRRTQVYDSVLVKSSNMRSQRTSLKIMTSFMAEPTLTLNVLADAVRNVNQAGGKAMLAKAGGTFVLSAVVQAFVKAALSIGRSPDKKKTKEENLVNRFAQYLIGEVNPFSLIPGYSSIVETIRNGELKDDAMSTIGKMFVSIQGFGRLFDGEDGDDLWREFEDSVGQLAQLFTNVPAKNLMRDGRAMFNWFAGGVYAERPMSAAVLKESVWSNIQTADTLTNALREKLFDAGYKTTNDAYYDRIWNARKSGDERAEEDLIEFMTAARGVGEKKITEEVNKRAKADESLSALEKAEYLNSESYVMEQYKAGKIGREDAERLLLQDREETEESVWWRLDRADFEKETGEKPSSNAKYYRLDQAIEDGASDAEIEKITKDMIEHGASEKEISKRLKGREDAAYDSFHAALKKGDLAAVEKAEQDLISQKLVTKSGLASKRKNYFINAFEEGEITRKQAEDGLKKFTDMAEDDVFWKIDKIDWMKSTGSNREPNDKYYRLDAAILNNKSEEISRAVKDMRAHGFTKDGVDKCIQYFKKDYLNATGDRKIKLRDALTKAYKANGMTADQALRTIDSWKTSKKKKK